MQEIVAGIALAVIGLVLAIFPVQVFNVTEKWKCKDKDHEISDTYKTVLRLVGGILAFVGIIVCFMH